MPSCASTDIGRGFGSTAFIACVFSGFLTASAIASEDLRGAPVQGLQLQAAVEDSMWQLGTTKVFNVTLTNVSASPFLIDLFGDLNEVYQGKRKGSYVTSCWALSWQPQAIAQSIHKGRYTLSANQFYRLSPNQSLTLRLSLQLKGVGPGSYQVRVAYIPRASASTFSFPDNWQAQQGLKEPMWMGMATSEAIPIRVIETID